MIQIMCADGIRPLAPRRVVAGTAGLVGIQLVA